MKTTVTPNYPAETTAFVPTTYHWEVTGDYNSSAWIAFGDVDTREEGWAAIDAAKAARRAQLNRGDLYNDVPEPIRSAIVANLARLADGAQWDDLVGYDEQATRNCRGHRFVAAAVTYTRDDPALPYYAEGIDPDAVRFYYEGDLGRVEWFLAIA